MAEHQDFAGKSVLITGGSRGIGFGLASHLGLRGADITITGRKEPQLKSAVQALNEMGITCRGEVSDVADRASTFAVVEKIQQRTGRLDGVVANAQTFRSVTKLEDVRAEDMEVLWQTGPVGTLWLLQAAFPLFVSQGQGRVVTMATSMGYTGAAGYGPYSASNEAIRSLTRTAANEWGQYGITVNCVLPASAKHREPPADEHRRQAFAEMYAANPVGRDGDAQNDIGPLVAFLLSDESGYVNGQTISADGGGILRA